MEPSTDSHRKAMTNLDSLLKSRDITLLTKVYIVKAVVFPVVMYECESWTIRKVECPKLMLLNCEDSCEPLGLQGIFIGRIDTEAEAPIFGHLM